MQGVNCVKGEIHNVLTVLHLSKPSRAAYDRNAFSAAEAPSPLVCGLQDLYSELGSVSDLRLFDTRAYLRPFLRVIHSENTDVVTTGIALQSVHKFLLYGHIHRDSPYVAEAISEIVYDVTNCTWSGNWKEESEVVRMKMLEVVLECLRCDAGDLLSDEAVCGMVKECFSARNRDGASKLLAKYAENILTHMVLVIFARLDPETRAGGTIDPTKALSSSPLKALLPSLRVTSRERNGSRSRNTHRRTTSQATAPALAASREEEAGRGFGQGEPYGIPALQSVFRFLANLIDPSDHSSDHNTKILGLRLIRTVFETAGKRLGFFPPLVEVIQNELCKNLLQSSQTRDIYVLSLVLRIIFDIFTSVKQHLKIQLEVFFSVIHLRVGESTAATFDHKRMVAESLLDFCKEPALIVGLYRNYDCEVGYSSLFEDLCQHLAQSAVPSDPPVPTTLHVLSFESVLAVLESISVRFCVEADPERKDDQEGSDEDEMLLLNPEEETRLAKQRQQKMKLRLAKDRFNAEGKKSLSFLQGLKLLADPLTPESVVTFFETTPGLDKTRIGEVLGASDDFSVKVLGHFCSTFDFQKLAVSNQSGEGQVSLPIDVGLRGFLDCFRLPGEAQQISRILELFSTKYYEYCSQCAEQGPLADADAAYVLCFSIIMLNTDAHNPNIAPEKKMTKEGFFRNNRGLNGKADFPQQYLSDLFDNIQNNEIQLTSELKDTDGGFSTKKWNNVLSSKNPGKFETSAPRAHGKEMFTLLWDSAVHTLEFYLFRLAPHVYAHTAEGAEPSLVRDLRRGFANFALICSRYTLGDVFNNLVISVCNSLCARLEQISEQEESASIFGRDSRSRLAVDILFALVKQHGPSLVREGWANILHVVLWLRKLKLLPAGLCDMEDFRDGKNQLFDSLRMPETLTAVEESAGGGGVVSALSSAFSFFWAVSADESEESASGSEASDTEPSPPKEDAHTLAAKACVEACDIPGVFTNSKYYEIGSLTALVRALLLVSSYGSGAQSLSSEVFSPAVLDHRAAVFCLERITDVLAHNQTRVAEEDAPLWAIVQDHFSLALASCTGDPTFYQERVVVNLLLHFPTRLRRDPVRTCTHVIGLLARLQTISSACRNALGTRVVAGLQIFLETHAEHINSSEQWKAVLDLLLQYRGHTHAGNSAFKAMEFVTEHHLTFESFVPLVTAYVQFAQPQQQVWQPVGPPAVLDGLLRLYTKLTVLGVPVEGEGLRAVSERDQDKLLARRTDLWLFTLQCLCQVCGDGRADVRMKAIACLQAALLSSGVKIKSPKAWHICFEKLLIPLLDLVAQFAPTAEQAKEAGGDIRLKAATVVFQTFLHNLDIISALPDFHIFWLKFIGSMERHMKGSEGQSVSVHFTEWLKNVLLVMHANGTFDLASKRSGQDLWALTWAVIDSFRPELRYQLMQNMQGSPGAPPPASSQNPSSNTQPPPLPNPPNAHYRPPPPPATTQPLETSNTLQNAPGPVNTTWMPQEGRVYEPPAPTTIV